MKKCNSKVKDILLIMEKMENLEIRMNINIIEKMYI